MGLGDSCAPRAIRRVGLAGKTTPDIYCQANTKGRDESVLIFAILPVFSYSLVMFLSYK